MELLDLFIDEDLNDKSGVSAIALVDSPAIEEGWMAFNKHKAGLKKHIITLGSQKGNFTPVAGDQQILAGALMVPNKEIYRRDDKTGFEYNVSFTPQTIKQIQRKFVLNNINSAVNQMHDNSKPVNGVLLQHFLIDRPTGVNPPFNQDHLEDGTWYGYINVMDKNIWDQFIKTGIYTGFSVEGYFYEQPVKLSEADIPDLAKVLDSL